MWLVFCTVDRGLALWTVMCLPLHPDTVVGADWDVWLLYYINRY